MPRPSFAYLDFLRKEPELAVAKSIPGGVSGE